MKLEKISMGLSDALAILKNNPHERRLFVTARIVAETQLEPPHIEAEIDRTFKRVSYDFVDMLSEQGFVIKIWN